MRHAIADGWLRRQPLTAAEALPPPEIPLPVIDPVFGPPLAKNGERQFGELWRRCAYHQTEWRGTADCWVCEAAT